MAVTRLSMGEIRELTDAELAAKIADYQKERAGLRFKSATEVLANPMDLRTARRMVARLRTVLAERAAKATAARAAATTATKAKAT